MWLNLLQQHLAAHFALAEACISIHLLTAVILGKNTHRHDFSSALLPHIFSFLQALHYPNQQKLGRASRLVNHTRIPWERLGQHSYTWERLYGMLPLKAREAAFWER